MRIRQFFRIGALTGPWSLALVVSTFVALGLIYKNHNDGIRERERARIEAAELRGQAEAARIQSAKLRKINARYLAQLNLYKERSAQSAADLRQLESNGNESTKDYLNVRVVNDMCDWLRDLPAALDVSQCGTPSVTARPIAPNVDAQAINSNQRRFVSSDRGTF